MGDFGDGGVAAGVADRDQSGVVEFGFGAVEGEGDAEGFFAQGAEGGGGVGGFAEGALEAGVDLADGAGVEADAGHEQEAAFERVGGVEAAGVDGHGVGQG